jgi:hypothetical protein
LPRCIKSFWKFKLPMLSSSYFSKSPSLRLKWIVPILRYVTQLPLITTCRHECHIYVTRIFVAIAWIYEEGNWGFMGFSGYLTCTIGSMAELSEAVMDENENFILFSLTYQMALHLYLINCWQLWKRNELTNFEMLAKNRFSQKLLFEHTEIILYFISPDYSTFLPHTTLLLHFMEEDDYDRVQSGPHLLCILI